ncbi:MAG: AbrB/MazE/SpoVT family DNA-binding domain-containing protein [Chloroflexi bacterium]|nr:AbrB/MazE/SpoVT family DNA-binding domain-containing protein [Chloroflexota bacterium]
MVTRVQRWGNSLAIRIPKAVAAEVGLIDKAAVQLQVIQGKIILERTQSPEETLVQLLARVTPENRHAEIRTGPARGGEAW